MAAIGLGAIIPIETVFAKTGTDSIDDLSNILNEFKLVIIADEETAFIIFEETLQIFDNQKHLALNTSYVPDEETEQIFKEYTESVPTWNVLKITPELFSMNEMLHEIIDTMYESDDES